MNELNQDQIDFVKALATVDKGLSEYAIEAFMNGRTFDDLQSQFKRVVKVVDGWRTRQTLFDRNRVMNKLKKIEVGSVVAFNTLPDATWFKVEAIKGFNLTVRQVGTDHAEHWIDKSAVKQVR